MPRTVNSLNSNSPKSKPKARSSSSKFKKQPPHAFNNRDDQFELPTTYIVRPTPSTSSAKQMRYLRRVFLHESIMKSLNLMLGELILIKAERATATDTCILVGAAWPSHANPPLDPDVIQLHPTLRQTHSINPGDRVTLKKNTSRVMEAAVITLACLDEELLMAEDESNWIDCLQKLLIDIKYVDRGMELECVWNEATSTDILTHRRLFEVLEVIEADSNGIEDEVRSLSNLRHSMADVSIHEDGITCESDLSSEPCLFPKIFRCTEITSVKLDNSSIQNQELDRLNNSVQNQTLERPDAEHISTHTPSKKITHDNGSGTNLHIPATPRTSFVPKKSSQTLPTEQSTKRGVQEDGPVLERNDTSEPVASVPDVTYDSIGGLSSKIAELREIVELPLLHPRAFARLNTRPSRGVLLCGPPGTGKTLLLKAVANATSAVVYTISGPSIISKYMGEAEERLREIWQKAEKTGPSIILIDEVDAIAPRRDNDGSEAENRVVASLLTLMDGMNIESKVVVVGSTNRPNAIDPALRRSGRFDKDIEIGIPDAKARLEILNVMLTSIPHRLSTPFVEWIANKTHGYVGADLSAVCRESVVVAIKQSIAAGLDDDKLYLEEEHVETALPLIRPSAMREIFLEPPKTLWSDIGGQDKVKDALKQIIEWPRAHPETLKRFAISLPKGVLLFGPPGCSKTLTAKALATESGLNFLAVKGPELFNKFVGEAERALREIFRKARAASPSIIFFDEIDALSGTRGDGGEGSADRILTTLLNEIDGIEDLVDVTILAATNRPDVIDAALLRPGRLEQLIYVGPPDSHARKSILSILFKKMAVSKDVDIDMLSEKTDGCSGAEIAAFCRDAGLLAMRDNFDAEYIELKHFESALVKLKRRITPEMIEFYESFAEDSGSL